MPPYPSRDRKEAVVRLRLRAVTVRERCMPPYPSRDRKGAVYAALSEP